jgi:hypothetical protein
MQHAPAKTACLSVTLFIEAINFKADGSAFPPQLTSGRTHLWLGEQQVRWS